MARWSPNLKIPRRHAQCPGRMFNARWFALRQRVLHAATPGSLRALVWRGAVWTIAGYGAAQLLRFGSNLILTRWLFPELFGLMVLVNTFLIGLALLSDFGIGMSIVQNRRGGEPEFLNTAWTMQVVRGMLLWLSSFLLATPFAEFYGEPILRWLIPIAALGALFAGFNATSLFTLQRELRIGTLTKIELGAQASGILVMLAWAWLAPNLWALVVGMLVSALYKLIASHRVLAGTRNRFVWDATAARAILTFGKWIFLSSAVTFFAEQSDRLILGKVVPLEILGVYGIALAYAEVPRQITLALAGNVLFPAFSSLREFSRPALSEKISRKRVRVLYVLAFAVVLFAAFGDFLVRVLYDARYWQAAWMLPLLALGLWPRLLCNTIEPALFALGKPQYSTAGQIARVVWTVGGTLLGFAWAGIFGAVLAIALNDVAYYCLINFGLWHEGLSELRQDAQATFVLVLFLFVVMSARFVLGGGLPFYG